jgi:peptidoglycan/xylan/chitin deacetylase (PgdA/CDA1 family)
MGSGSAERSPCIPVLLYHAVTDTPGEQIRPFTVRPAEFADQLDAILAAGYECVTFGELVRREATGDGLSGRMAVITFDDGYADFAEHALPALRARSLVSTLYVTTGWLEDAVAREPGPTDRMLSFAQLPELLSEGVELGAHSHSHPQLDTLSAAALRAELSRPKQLLEDALGRPVTTFAYPHGYNGPRVRRLVREAGYDSGAAVRNALHRRGEDRFAISRLTLTSETSFTTFSGWLHGAGALADPSREAWKTRGWRAYRRGRAMATRRPGSDYR